MPFPTDASAAPHTPIFPKIEKRPEPVRNNDWDDEMEIPTFLRNKRSTTSIMLDYLIMDGM